MKAKSGSNKNAKRTTARKIAEAKKAAKKVQRMSKVSSSMGAPTGKKERSTVGQSKKKK